MTRSDSVRGQVGTVVAVRTGSRSRRTGYTGPVTRVVRARVAVTKR